MNKIFQYTKTEGQGWLVGEKDKFKYDYPDPGKEMELGKDFEVKFRVCGVTCHPKTESCNNYCNMYKEFGKMQDSPMQYAIPIVDLWKEVEEILEYGSNPIEELKSKFTITKK